MIRELEKGCFVVHKDAPGMMFTFKSYGYSGKIIAYIKEVGSKQVEEHEDLKRSHSRPDLLVVLTANLSMAPLATILRGGS